MTNIPAFTPDEECIISRIENRGYEVSIVTFGMGWMMSVRKGRELVDVVFFESALERYQAICKVGTLAGI